MRSRLRYLLIVPILITLVFTSGCFEIVGPGWDGGGYTQNGLELILEDRSDSTPLRSWAVTVDIDPHYLSYTNYDGYVWIPTGTADRVEVTVNSPTGLTRQKTFRLDPGINQATWRI